MRAVALAAALAIAACNDPAPAERTATVREGDVVPRVLLTGALRPVNAVELFVPPADQALAIHWLVADGTIVAAGDRVAELDRAPFDTVLHDLHTASRTQEATYEVQRRGTEVTLQGKRYDVRRAEIERDRAAMHAQIPADLQLGRTAQENQLHLIQTETRLASTRNDLEAAIQQSALEQRVQDILRDKTRRSIANTEQAIAALEIHAPRAGVAVIETRDDTGRKYAVGEQVLPAMALVSMPDLARPMEVTAALSDVDDGRVATGMTGTCTLDAYPADPVDCTVETVAPVAQPQPGRDSLRKSFAVTLSLAHVEPARLRPGMAFEVELKRAPVHALVVPRAAVFASHHVALASGEIRVVELGPCDAQQCAIARGLAAGDVVVVGDPS